jgi:hypothetical protein
MRKALTILGVIFAVYWGYGWFTEPSEGPVRVRFTNSTEDTGVRIWFVAFDRASALDLEKGEQEINDRVLSGERFFVVYEPLSEKIIATGKYTLKEKNEKNLDVLVKGNKKKGYTLLFEQF